MGTERVLPGEGTSCMLGEDRPRPPNNELCLLFLDLVQTPVSTTEFVIGLLVC